MNTKKKGSALKMTPGSTKKHLRTLRVDQLFPDPNQPRVKFRPEKLQELADSIDAEGLQQAVTVQFAFKKDGVEYFCLRVGERRWRAHGLLKKAHIECVVESGVYDGTVRDVNRRLAQAAENSTHEPHTHGEIIQLAEEIVADEIQKSGSRHGSVEVGLRRVAAAFGKKLSWAVNYRTLGDLLPELREMLDEDDAGERLNFGVALALARAPADIQTQLLKEAEPHFKKGGHAAGYSFIVRRAREIREARGEKVRGRGFDEKMRFIGIATRLQKFGESVRGGHRAKEYEAHLKVMVDKMSVSEVDIMLSDLRAGLQTFDMMREALEAQRKLNYRGLALAKA